MKTIEEEALDLFTIEEILEMCNMDEADALSFLRYHGLLEFPPFLLRVLNFTDEHGSTEISCS